MRSPVAPSTAAGVVVFGPDPEILMPLVTSVLEDVDFVFVFVNAVIDAPLLQRLQELGPRCGIILSEHNLGVAEALNQIALHAILHGCERVILFDQDSRPPQGMVAQLSRTMDRLAEAGEAVAVIGPRIVAPKGRADEFKNPRYFPMSDRQGRADALPVQYIITSGSLIDLSAFRKIGSFRSDFFIDAIDTEWCFRAWAKGYSCWFAPGLPMEHTIGQGAIRSKIFGIRFPHQSPMRMYSYFRNQAASILLPHVPPRWKIKFGLHILLLAVSIAVHLKLSPSAMRSIGKALLDGVKGRLGPPPGAALCPPPPDFVRNR